VDAAAVVAAVVAAVLELGEMGETEVLWMLLLL
jgi:hypothetical protein